MSVCYAWINHYLLCLLLHDFFCRFLSLLARFDRSVRLYGVSLRLCDPVIGIFFDPSRRLPEHRSLDYLHMALRCCTDPRATPPHTLLPNIH